MPIRKSEAKSAADGASSGDVIDELRRRYDRLTQSQKRIAEYIVEHSQTVAFSTVDQMAAQLDVNPSTIVRFTYRLGLNGFPDLQERMRELVRGQLSRTGDPINEGQVAAHLEGTSFGASLSHDWQNLHRTISGLDAAAVGRAVNILSRARRVYVVAGFSTFPVAHYFALVLDRLRSDISLLASNAALCQCDAPRRAVGEGEQGQGDCGDGLADIGGRTARRRGPARRFGRNRNAEFHGGANGRGQCAAQRCCRGQGNARARALQSARPVDEPLGRVPAQIG
jgi:Helix-turn-helix domain, rpiR family